MQSFFLVLFGQLAVYSCIDIVYTMAVFKTKLVKWGNSVGVTLPKPIRDTFNLKAGDEVELIDKNGYVMIKKSR
jgi:AbrB family looped-hinge helix DNA binding protein